MFKLGLTGSIATGKSTALKVFAERGHETFSSDEAVHELYRDEAVEPVGRAFPGAVRDGAVDRAALARILVEDPARIAELEAIVHPLVRRRIAAFTQEAEDSRAGLAVIDVPLLFESGHDYGFDAVAVTWCDDDEQRRRVLARPGMNVEKLETLLERQLPQDEKRRRADFEIDTNGTPESTRVQIEAIARACLKRDRTGKTT